MTPVQHDLFEGRAARDAALTEVDANTAEDWRRAAYRAIRSLALVHDEFTTDLVWQPLNADGYETHEPRAMGAVVQAAVKAGTIEKTGLYSQSTRKVCHCRDIPIYKSLLR